MAIEASDFMQKVEAHMQAQPYSITCDECGNDLEVKDATFDGDYDLNLIVAPCEKCTEEAREAGRPDR